MRQLIQLIELEIDVSFGEIKQIVLYLKNADVNVENVLPVSYTHLRAHET